MEKLKELEELYNLKQWVNFKLQTRNGKTTKIPVNSKTGRNAKTNDPATWSTFSEALEASKRFDGVGFMLYGYCGIDIDHCIDEAGNIKEYANDIIQTLNSYTEISPSGTGIHILCKGELKTGSIKNEHLEIYKINDDFTGGRYFTITQNIFGEIKPIAERTNEIEKIIMKYSKKENMLPLETVEAVDTLEDTEVLTKMFHSRNGKEIEALWNGDLSRHGNDHSGADLALCNHLAFFTKGNAGQIDRLFRSSGLFATEKKESGRNKWDVVHDGKNKTYGQMTIEKALEQYHQKETATASTGATATREAEQMDILEEDNALNYLDNGFLDGDIKNFSQYRNRKTGFANLDKIQPFYSGLYVIGAGSGIGKTTFTQQLGDQLAKAGEHVLFFTLEQSRLEILSKELSRITAQLDPKKKLSSIAIRRGQSNEVLPKAKEIFRQYAKNLNVIEGELDITAQKITDYVEKYIHKYKMKPVVIVDYLQFIQPKNHESIKEAVDTNLKIFKQLQRKYDLAIVLISSINRTNYYQPIDFESFKESGNIEFTADVVWGLQLDIFENAIFDKNESSSGSVKRQQKALYQSAKKSNPRKMELVVLKNRFGISNYNVYFDYEPDCDLFKPSYRSPEETKKQEEVADIDLKLQQIRNKSKAN